MNTTELKDLTKSIKDGLLSGGLQWIPGINSTMTVIRSKPEYKSKYRYDEDRSLEELKNYVDSTYGEHYARTRIQTGEYLEGLNIGSDFYRGNIIKYASRYGVKGGKNKKDLLKILHYALMLLSLHNKEEA